MFELRARCLICPRGSNGYLYFRMLSKQIVEWLPNCSNLLLCFYSSQLHRFWAQIILDCIIKTRERRSQPWFDFLLLSLCKTHHVSSEPNSNFVKCVKRVVNTACSLENWHTHTCTHTHARTHTHTLLFILKSVCQFISCSNTSVQHKLPCYRWTNSRWTHEFKEWNSSLIPVFNKNFHSIFTIFQYFLSLMGKDFDGR